MKKFLAVFLALCMVFALCACGEDDLGQRHRRGCTPPASGSASQCLGCAGWNHRQRPSRAVREGRLHR